MNPFFFGSAERALYGAYHPPKVRGGSRQGVVLCYPFGVEYMRAHRAFRQLTNLLTRAGLHVLRFDYYGTGDSVGEGDDAGLGDWTADVGTAIRELRDTAGIDRVTLVGLRLGATLAARAGRERDDVERIVLWDPVVSGRRYLSEGLRQPVGAGGARELTGDAGVLGVQGFPMSEELVDELLALHFADGAGRFRMPVELVTSREDEDFTRLHRAIERKGGRVRFHLVPSEGNWAEGDAFGSALLPQGIIQAIVEIVAKPADARQRR